MQRTMLNSKIHRATVTQVDINYVGSISIDTELLEEAGIYKNEQVHVLNIENGARIVTYAIPAKAGSGMIGVNGAAAHLFEVGDKVIICSYVSLESTEIDKHEPKVILVDTENRSKGDLPVGFASLEI